jgi:hypothetical protein
MAFPHRFPSHNGIICDVGANGDAVDEVGVGAFFPIGRVGFVGEHLRRAPEQRARPDVGFGRVAARAVPQVGDDAGVSAAVAVVEQPIGLADEDTAQRRVVLGGEVGREAVDAVHGALDAQHADPTVSPAFAVEAAALPAEVASEGETQRGEGAAAPVIGVVYAGLIGQGCHSSCIVEVRLHAPVNVAGTITAELGFVRRGVPEGFHGGGPARQECGDLLVVDGHGRFLPLWVSGEDWGLVSGD